MTTKQKPATAADACKLMEKAVFKIARTFTKTNPTNFNDACQLGFEGVCEAYNRFDDKAGAAFSSYAYMWIRARIKDELMKEWRTTDNTFTNQESYNEEGEIINDEAYDTDWDGQIEMERKLNALEPIDRQIVLARTEGFTFQEIATAMTKIGQPSTLHQVRNRFIAATA